MDDALGWLFLMQEGTGEAKHIRIKDGFGAHVPVPKMSRLTPTMPVMAPPYGSMAQGTVMGFDLQADGMVLSSN